MADDEDALMAQVLDLAWGSTGGSAIVGSRPCREMKAGGGITSETSESGVWGIEGSTAAAKAGQVLAD